MELDFPTIESPAAEPAPSTAVTKQPSGDVDLAKIDLQAVALSAFSPARAAIATAHAKLTGVVHDLSTTTKLTEAKSMRHRLIGAPLAETRKTSAALKSKLTAVSKAVGTELAAIEAAFEAADQLIKPAIDAREAEIAEEKRIAAEKEEARLQKHRDALAKLAEPAERCRQPDMTAERIAKGIELVTAIVIDRAAWEEFADRAEEQKAVTLERMQALHAAAVAAEAEAARLAAEKAEQERKAAELKAEADRLAAERAEFERQKAELQAEKDRAAAEKLKREEDDARAMVKDALKLADAIGLGDTKMEAPQAGPAGDGSQKPDGDAAIPPARAGSHFAEHGSQQVLKAEASTPDATDRDAHVIASPSVGSMGAGQAADAAPVAGVTELPALSLGEIKARIAPLSIDAAGLESLGFPAKKVKASCMYRASDLPDMLAAMRKVLA
jgi:hypothetical protein